MTEHEQSVQYINEYIAISRAAQAEFEKMTQEQVDLAVKTIGKVVYENAEYLAKLAVEETRMGNVEDKIAKNKQKAGIVWNNLRGKKSRGILDNDEKACWCRSRHYPLHQPHRDSHEQRHVRPQVRQRHHYYRSPQSCGL